MIAFFHVGNRPTGVRAGPLAEGEPPDDRAGRLRWLM